MVIIALGFSACSEGNDDPTMVNPTDPKALTGTWVGDLTGKTFSLWNYGKAWNVWTFKLARNLLPCSISHSPTLPRTANWLP